MQFFDNGNTISVEFEYWDAWVFLRDRLGIVTRMIDPVIAEMDTSYFVFEKDGDLVDVGGEFADLQNENTEATFLEFCELFAYYSQVCAQKHFASMGQLIELPPAPKNWQAA